MSNLRCVLDECACAGEHHDAICNDCDMPADECECAVSPDESDIADLRYDMQRDGEK